MPRKRGRPSSYDEKKGKLICKRISNGETLKDILTDKGMPHRDTVWEWRQKHKDFSDLYAQARADQAHTWADDIVSIADNIQEDYLRDAKGEPVLKDGKAIYIKEAPQRTAQRIETRKWLIERINREDYGAKMDVNHSHSVADKDDAEMLHDLRQAAASMGVTPKDLAALMTGKAAVN